MALVIVMNALVIGLETDLPAYEYAWQTLEDLFLAIFAVELTLRLYGLQCEFFTGGDFGWNLFDLVLVVSGSVDFALSEAFPAIKNSFGLYAILMRVFRLLRILRIFRLFKMWKQLHLLANGFAESAISVFWVSVLCSLCLYVCAICLTRCLGRGTPENSIFAGLAVKFSSVKVSMFTLFELMADPNLEELQAGMLTDPALMVFFIMFITLGSFAMLSILTGVISEGMIQKGNAHKEAMRCEEEQRKKAFVNHLREYFQNTDADGDGKISRAEFEDNLRDMVEMFREHDLDYDERDLEMVFDLVDFDGGGDIELEEFLESMQTFTGGIDDLPLKVMQLQSALFSRLKLVEGHVTNSVSSLQSSMRNVDLQIKNTDWNSIPSKVSQIARAMQQELDDPGG